MFSIGSKSATVDKDALSRSLAKAITWRLTGSIDTFILSFLITGSIKIAGSISAVEVITITQAPGRQFASRNLAP
jgi:uncharacterized membrane protein